MNAFYLSLPDLDWEGLFTFYFTDYLISKSELFSFSYYNSAEEPMSDSCKGLRKRLAPLLIASSVKEAPPAHSINCIHCPDYYETEYYIVPRNNLLSDSLKSIGLVLESVSSLFDWRSPKLPANLCFYRNGICWFTLHADEKHFVIFTDSKKEIDEILHFQNYLHAHSMNSYNIIPNPTIEAAYYNIEDSEVPYIPEWIQKKGEAAIHCS